MNEIDPKEYGLPPRTVLEMVDETTIAIVINRKSRIILADGRKILEKAQKLKGTAPWKTIVVKTTAPVCGKTKAFLSGEGVEFLG